MKFVVYSSLVLLFCSVLSCEKDLNPKGFTGIYRGVFNRVNKGVDTTGTGVVFLVINTEDSTFHLQGDTITLTPASSGGKYSLPEPGKIQFTNTKPIGVPIYDPFYILDTVYNFEFNDPNLRIFMGVDTLFYDYNLKRF